MHPDIRHVGQHMREFGLTIFGRAIHDAVKSELTPFVHALAVVHAAHAAEILFKARIADEHPLLIFSKFPGLGSTDGLLDVEHLFEHGQSWDYFALPNLLWCTTGIRIGDLARYQSFGRLRNQIIHFAVPNVDLRKETLRYCFETIEPELARFWPESPIADVEAWDDSFVDDGTLEQLLRDEGIRLSATAEAFFRERAQQ